MNFYLVIFLTAFFSFLSGIFLGQHRKQNNTSLPSQEDNTVDDIEKEAIRNGYRIASEYLSIKELSILQILSSMDLTEENYKQQVDLAFKISKEYLLKLETN